jgi:hypothetical protein
MLVQVTVESLAAVGALLSDLNIQLLHVGLCRLTKALNDVAYVIGFAVTAVMIVMGVAYAYRIYRKVQSRGEYLFLFFGIISDMDIHIKGVRIELDSKNPALTF